MDRAREIRPRDVELDYAKVPRHWMGGSVVGTHIANGVNLLFPAGERFFVRSVHAYLDRVTDPSLRAQVKGFFGQEGRHAKEHERFFRVLERQGYDVARFLELYEKLAYGFIEKISSKELRLATTAACEHFTALLAENALTARFLDQVAPTAMRDLLLWHASEEIEHRAVAFDVLQLVNPSYALRVAGLAMATACLSGFWIAGTLHLLAQEDAKWSALFDDWKKLKRARAGKTTSNVFKEGIRAYLRRDFHPLDNDLDRLAADYLASAALA
jgi:predicted metal-dependent hydrolase